ncbi:MAG: DUF6082 family protein [Gammaproteobacteria bacterium]|jgi:hypothetical protein
MRKIDIGQVIQHTANIGVLLGIVFLAAEIRVNTRAIQAQTRDSISEKEMQLYAWQATNPELAQVVVKVRTAGVEALEPVERQMWFGYAEAFFREHENALYQFETGLFSESEFAGRVENIRGVLTNTGAFRNHWEARRDLFSPSLQAEIDSIMNETESR